MDQASAEGAGTRPAGDAGGSTADRRRKRPKIRRMKIIGLMSGTSADGVDAALVDWPDDASARPFELQAYIERPFPRDAQARIHRLADRSLPGEDVLAELVAVDAFVAEALADAAEAVAAEAGVPLAGVRAIASHGQTVAHHPEHGGTLQIGSPSRLAERTGRPVVANFRPRDMAAGGEGAPLAPFFHHAAFADVGEGRAVLNLGGMSNITWLPAGGDPGRVVAFDIGPANALIDAVLVHATEGRERMDRDGMRGRRGRVDDELLEELLDDPYFTKPPPKSTGRERYGRAEAEVLAKRCVTEGRALDDLIATLVALTSRSVALAVDELLPAIDADAERPGRLLACGGGAFNPTLIDALQAALPDLQIERCRDHGVPDEAVEAIAFSLMGRNAVLGLPNHLPACTGASRAAVLGERVPGADGQI